MNMFPRNFRAPKSRDGSKGATLIIALIFLIIMSLGTFFAHRGMVLDQNVAGNYYRSTRALMAAESGLEIMAARLRDYAQRESILTNDGTTYTGFAASPPIYRPTSADLGTVTATATGQVTALVTLSAVGPVSGPFAKLRIDAIGCWDDTGTDATCSTCSTNCPTTAQVSQILAFVGGLTGVPSAPLTTKGNANLGGSAITVTNTDPETNGLTVHAGGSISVHSSTANLITLPGTPPMASLAPSDSELSTITPDQYFEKFFAKDKDSYKNSADEIIVCGGVCNTSVNGKTGRIMWVDVPAGSSFVLNATTVVGSLSAPVILVVNGPLELRGSATIYGVAYSTSTLWDNTGGGTSQIIGAAIAEGNFTANGTPNPVYNADVLKKLSGRIGNYTKIPGSWRDF
ncbi:hypothetical protein HW932_18955 [Allochromatium humboldtianum]|uniref:Type 4 fimbrial biogenesis protein PilX N-terminal domain-containing protein n=1 Tax=Allochromatium humboldtianum TaxID=504901 RepID=A0A850RQZ8_9GAMM|nr:PilX N-terminal domain-containing pilus assembly protein [Allochromatium humboldtianum]NVZ11333.1 hypothetical protein [Allochromatium humboldtianum]